ncbi:MAG: hypothetical protein JXA71_09470 [Chitinispirillaceae bacterium]|nr:hypothetical protein [Chitinispirillaceae bacterium]
MHNLHEGGFRKSVTVQSNAKNTPALRLSVSGYFKTVLEIEPHAAIRLSGAPGSDTGEVIRIRTSKKFTVKKVAFTFKEGEQGMDWEIALPVKFTYKYVSADKAAGGKNRGRHYKGKPLICQIRLFHTPKLRDDKWGEFRIYTDLKERKEITVSGMMEAKK